MGRRKKSARVCELPACKFDLHQVLGPLKGSYENHNVFAVPGSRQPKRQKIINEEMRYGSVSGEISSYTARSEELCKRVEQLLMNPLTVCTPSKTPPALTQTPDFAFTKSNNEKNSCRRNLLLNDFGSLGIDDSISSSLGSLQKSDSPFSLEESGSDQKECQDMPPPDRLDIHGVTSIESNDNNKLDIVVQQECVTIEISDDECCVLQSEDKFQYEKEKDLEDIEKDTANMLDNQGDRHIIAQYKEDVMQGSVKDKQDGGLSKRQDVICEKGSVDKKLNNNAYLSHKHVDLRTKYGKDELHVSLENSSGFQNASKGMIHCVQENIKELHEDKSNEPEEIAARVELDVVNNLEVEFPWERHAQDGSDEEENDGLSSLWKEMSLAIRCSQAATITQETDSTSDKDGLQDCIHSFIEQDDLGKVCILCGFIGQSIETMFDIQWPKPRKTTKHSRHAPARDIETVLGIDNAQAFDCKRPEQKSPVKTLVLHPLFKKKIKSHQIDGFDFLQKNLVTEEPGGCILAHAPGTGKTFLVICFIQSFLAKYPDERPLIVAPKSILCSWMNEFEKWHVEKIPLYNLYEQINKAESLRSKQLQTLKEWKEKKSILLVSYSQFSNIVCENAESQMTASCQKLLLEGPGLLILDEGHFPRNKDTNILHALSQVRTRRRVLLSGTLFQNNIKELFNLLRLIRPDILELDSFQAILRRLVQSIAGSEMYQKLIYRRHTQDPLERIFCDVLDYALQSSSEEVKMSALRDLQELTALFVHYYRGDILEDLPGLVDFTVKLKLNDRQRRALSKVQNLTNRMSRDIMSSAVCIHPSLDGDISGWLESDSNVGSAFSSIRADSKDGVKTKFVLDILSLCESTKEKLIVFSQYLPPLALLENMIMNEKKWTKNHEMLRLDGSTPADVRGRVIEQFNNDSDSKVLFASIKASGEGICLTGASRVIILDIPWNPSITRQAISRAYRIGQKNKVYAYRLVAAGSLEEEIQQASLKKELMSKMLFEGGNQPEDSISLLIEVNQDDCEDNFFQSGSPLRENVHALYKQILV